MDDIYVNADLCSLLEAPAGDHKRASLAYRVSKSEATANIVADLEWRVVVVPYDSFNSVVETRKAVPSIKAAASLSAALSSRLAAANVRASWTSSGSSSG